MHGRFRWRTVAYSVALPVRLINWGLRDYGNPAQIGLERTPDEYVASLVAVFREVWRVLKDDGTLWLNLADSYSNTSASAGGAGKQWTNHGTVQMRGITKPIAPGLKPKDLVGIPWRVAFALQADGWYLRSDIIWSKPNPMPESVRDRPTKSHEYIFLLSKAERYYFDADAVSEPATYAGKVVTLGEKSLSRGQANGAGIAPSGNGTAESVTVADTRNIRSVWPIATQPYSGAHFATFPEEIPTRCILAGSALNDVVLDPFAGSGTTVKVARDLGRYGVGLEISKDYLKLANARVQKGAYQEVLL
jgi:DNA modification methylase